MSRDVFPPTDFAEPPESRFGGGSDDLEGGADISSRDGSGLAGLLFGKWNSLWFLLMAIGFGLFELTAQPALVVVAICTKFGISDLRNGYWLRRRDPARVRGKVVFWFSLSRGLWKTTVAAFLAMIGFVFLAMIFQQRQLVAPGHVVGSGATFLFAFVLASLTTLVGVILARIAGVRVWLDAGLAESRRANEFPPPETGFNRVSLILAASLILPVLTFLVLLAGVAQANPAAIRNAIGFLIGMFVLPVAIIAAGTALSKSIVAREWDDCWAWEPSPRRSLRDVAIQEGVIDGQADCL